MNEFKFSIIGSGNLGQVIGKVLHRLGYNVLFYDVDRSKLTKLKALGFQVCYSLEDCSRRSNISFICVPTPTVNGKHYSGHVRQVVLGLANLVKDKQEYHLIVIKSTVLPLDVEEICSAAGKGNFGICFSPEFLRSELAEFDFTNIPRIVIGVRDDRPKEILKNLYDSLSRKTCIRYELVFTDVKTASLIKYASNCMLAAKISFYNEFKKVADMLGVDITTIIRNTITDDKKTDIWSFMDDKGWDYGKGWYRRDFLKHGFDDECLPKDLEAFLSFCTVLGQDMKLLRAVKEVNDSVRSEIGV